MSPRYNPNLTDGTETRSLTYWRGFAKTNGYIIEPMQERPALGFNIIDFACCKPKTIKQLQRVKIVHQ